MKRGTIALIFLAAGVVGLFLMDGEIDGLRGILVLMGAIGMSYFLTPKTKMKRGKPRSKL